MAAMNLQQCEESVCDLTHRLKDSIIVPPQKLFAECEQVHIRSPPRAAIFKSEGPSDSIRGLLAEVCKLLASLKICRVSVDVFCSPKPLHLLPAD